MSDLCRCGHWSRHHVVGAHNGCGHCACRGFDPLPDRDDWPIHRPPAPDAPIPGRHWHSACEPGNPRVTPEGVCELCGEKACPTCGRGFYPDGDCGCVLATPLP